MSLTPGTRVGPYEVVAPLGAGGMGEVYRAHDTQLDRDVALKILPESFAADAGRLMRFEREAKALAALNHPNIAQIYDVEDAGGVRALVMELVGGHGLDEVISSRLTIDGALAIARQIAEALDAAHGAGIIHRDLKPANIKVTENGTVKVLDFGLAKALDPSVDSGGSGVSQPGWGPGDGSPAGRSAALPTMTSPASTEAGMIMGTTAYMSPEQASAGRVDRATDLWAFGIVLFEMLAAVRPFSGETNAHVMAAILREDLDWTLLPADTPGRIRLLLRRCLEKDPRRRLRDAREAWVAVDEALHAPADSQGPPPRPRGLGLPLVAGIVVVTAAVTAAAMLWGVMPALERPGPPVVELESPRRVTFEEGLETRPSISPDGTQVAYASGAASRMRVYIRSVTGGRPRPLSDETNPLEIQPAYSPTGDSILFLTPSGAFRAPALGGQAAPVALAAAPGVVVPAGGIDFPVSAAAWSPDAERVFIARGRDTSIASVAGGPETSLGTSSDALHSCSWSPRGTWVACTEGNANSVIPGNNYGNIAPSAVVLISTEDGTVREVTDRVTANLSPAWSADGDVLFFVSNRQGPYDIFMVEIAGDGRVEGEPTRVTTGLDARSLSVSASGTHAVFETYAATANLWSLPIPAGGAPVDAEGAEQLTSAPQLIESMSVSSDGQSVVYDSTLSGNADVYLVPTAGGTPVQLTDHPADDFAPSLSPDNREIAYHSWRTGSRDIFVQPVQGGTPQAVTSSPSQESYPRWSPDGRRLAFFDQAIADGRRVGLFLVERTGGNGWGEPVLLKPGAGHYAWLPDGETIAYESRGAVEVISVSTGDSRVVYAPASADDPTVESVEVSADGRVIYFKSHDRLGRAALWSVPVGGGRPTMLVRFTDDARPSLRPDFSVGAGRFFFTTEDRQSDVWVAGLIRPSPGTSAGPSRAVLLARGR